MTSVAFDTTTTTDAIPGFRSRTARMVALLVTANLLAWGWALLAFGHRPVLLGTAFLAYTLGLRHALDADHIAAIDNVTRKLMQAGQRPIAVGLFFSLGHSAVVVLASAAVALAAHSVADKFAAFRGIGDVIGTAVSALFLCTIAMTNLVVLRGIYQAYRRARRGEPVAAADVDALLAHQGGLIRGFRPLFPARVAKLAPVADRHPVRARHGHRERDQPVRPVGADLGARSPAGRSWSSPPCSPPA